MVRTLWFTSAVFFVGAIASMYARHDDTALVFAAVGFFLVSFLEMRIDWQRRITRNNWKQSLFESSGQTTLMGKLAQVLGFVCLVAFFFVGRH